MVEPEKKDPWKKWYVDYRVEIFPGEVIKLKKLQKSIYGWTSMQYSTNWMIIFRLFQITAFKCQSSILSIFMGNFNILCILSMKLNKYGEKW